MLRSSGIEEWIVGALDKSDGNTVGEYQILSQCKLRLSTSIWLSPIKDVLNHNSAAAATISREAPHTHTHTHLLYVHIGHTSSYF